MIKEINRDSEDLKNGIIQSLADLKSAARVMSSITSDQVNGVLNAIADQIGIQKEAILEANQKDLDRMDPQDPKYDRLLLNSDRLDQIATEMRHVAGLPSPLNELLEDKTLENGLHLRKVTVPLGVIGVVFESRPNVTFDVFALSFKSGNAVVLKGSRDAHYSNIAIVELIQKVLNEYDIPRIVYLAPSERASLSYILEADEYIDMVIPRGSKGLIEFVRANAKVPVIETGAGIVHTYIDADADVNKAKRIITNAKTRRVSVCNALDTLLVHRQKLNALVTIFEGLDKEYQLIIHADSSSFDCLQGHYDSSLLRKAFEDSYGKEFLSMQISIKVVESIDEALDHIFTYSSKHSEAIVSESPSAIARFQNEIDAATIYANASTAFTDGAQFGLGAEIGISTQKLHARGPMALKELTSYKWLINGDGHTRS